MGSSLHTPYCVGVFSDSSDPDLSSLEVLCYNMLLCFLNVFLTIGLLCLAPRSFVHPPFRFLWPHLEMGNFVSPSYPKIRFSVFRYSAVQFIDYFNYQNSFVSCHISVGAGNRKFIVHGIQDGTRNVPLWYAGLYWSNFSLRSVMRVKNTIHFLNVK